MAPAATDPAVRAPAGRAAGGPGIAPAPGEDSKADRAYRAILEGIQQGRFAPGSRLVLAQLAAELDMSVVPVREAIRRLQHDDLVSYERNVGATVVGVNPQEYQYTMETLALVEGFSTAQCAPLVTAEELDRARAINARMRALLAAGFDPVEFTALNKEFHSTLFEHHQNPHILDLVHRGWNRLTALRSSTFAHVPARARDSVDEHDALLDLIAAGAPFAEIEAAARRHRTNTLDAYMATMAAPSAS
ncbi:GntR family transcriptional regulator [Citricoccus sp. SGAir0253]|uniref:GntR family transcriptional regulator n=1 Tax=Citricoccus sp. SGAir0253 TaxID=2567881 RepID=UPI0010CD0E6D|nr:GntR family transcriptional regulator [Citricoccus sp. SGAir0253]QCU79084.1 GntR family transcriptional regulator [Citricoccus sp. SGAir0253]